MKHIIIGTVGVAFLAIGAIAYLLHQCIISLLVFSLISSPFLTLSVLNVLFKKRLSGAVPGSFVAGTMICETEEEY